MLVARVNAQDPKNEFLSRVRPVIHQPEAIRLEMH
jgi:hypothetical protein